MLRRRVDEERRDDDDVFVDDNEEPFRFRKDLLNKLFRTGAGERDLEREFDDDINEDFVNDELR